LKWLAVTGLIVLVGAIAGVLVQLLLHPFGVTSDPSTHGADWWAIGGAVVALVYSALVLLWTLANEHWADRRTEREAGVYRLRLTH
jgi:hypothetical protein